MHILAPEPELQTVRFEHDILGTNWGKKGRILMFRRTHDSTFASPEPVGELQRLRRDRNHESGEKKGVKINK